MQHLCEGHQFIQVDDKSTNIYISHSRFINFQIEGQAAFQVLHSFANQEEPLTASFKFENNIIRSKQEITFQFFEFETQTAPFQVDFIDNQFINISISTSKGLIQANQDESGNLRLNFRGNKIQNVNCSTLMRIRSEHLSLTDIEVSDSQIHYILIQTLLEATQSNMISIDNLAIQNVQDSFQTASQRQSFIKIQDSLSLNVARVILKNCQFSQADIFFIDNLQTASLIEMNFSDSSLQRTRIISVQKVYNLMITQVALSNIDSRERGTHNLSREGSFFLRLVNELDEQSNVIVSKVTMNDCLVLQAISLEGDLHELSAILFSQFYLSNNSLIQQNGVFFLIEVLQTNEVQNAVQFERFSIYNNSIQSLGTIFSIKSGIQITIKNSNVTSNEGTFLKYSPYRVIGHGLTILNVFFNKNSGSDSSLIYAGSSSSLLIIDSLFTENYSLKRSSILEQKHQNSKVTIINCKFISNYGTQGGVFKIENNNHFLVQDSFFYNNFAHQGGVLYGENDPVIRFLNTNMTQNYALLGGIFYLAHCKDSTHIKGGKIQRNGLQYNPLLVSEIENLKQNNSPIQKSFQFHPSYQKVLNEAINNQSFEISKERNYQITLLNSNNNILKTINYLIYKDVSCVILYLDLRLASLVSPSTESTNPFILTPS